MSDDSKLAQKIRIAEALGDYQKSFKLHLQAAQRGNVVAMAEVATMYMKGLGTDKNLNEGFIWMLQAAQGGYPNAMAILAKMYELGIGTQSDVSEALRWYVDAANAGEPHAKKFMEKLFESKGDN